MILTLLEILLFVVLAALIGLALGWILRGTMSTEQAELADLRSKLRECRKSLREQGDSAASDSAGKTKAAAATAASSSASKTKAASTTAVKASAPKAAAADGGEDKAAEQAAARAEVSKLVARIGSDGVEDDLTRIYGIGPKFKGMLNDMGITSFKQIAQFTQGDIDTVASAIGAFKDRVVRDDWVSGAKAAYKEKYGQSA